METLGIAGFAVLLAGWFGMFFRVRRDHPDSPLSDYRTYIGARVLGARRSGFSLLPFYWRHYGLDLWSSTTTIGLVLVVVAVLWEWRARS